MSLREQILAKDDITAATINIPEWATDDNATGWFQLRTLNGKQFQALAKFVDADGNIDYAPIVVLCLLDKEGNKVFHVNDSKALSEKSGPVIARIAKDVLTHNGLTNEAIEETEKN